MEELRNDIENEMKRVRINKSHVYNTLLRIINVMDTNSVSSLPAVSTSPPVEEVAESVTSPQLKSLVLSLRLKFPQNQPQTPRRHQSLRRGRTKKAVSIAVPDEAEA